MYNSFELAEAGDSLRRSLERYMRLIDGNKTDHKNVVAEMNEAHCRKCGAEILGNDNSLCGNCAA